MLNLFSTIFRLYFAFVGERIEQIYYREIGHRTCGDSRVRFPRICMRVRRYGSAHARAGNTRFIANVIKNDGRHCRFRARIVVESH